MPEHLFYRIIYSLQKHQLIGFELLQNLMASDKGLVEQLCDQEQWDFYRRSKEFENTLQLIRVDHGFIKPYFNEVQARTLNFLKGHSTDTKVKKFFTILNNDLTLGNQAFEEVYQDTLSEFLKHLQENALVKKNSRTRDVLQTALYVFVCKNLNGRFKWKETDNSTFHEFYDLYDNISEEKLLEEVAEQFSKI